MASNLSVLAPVTITDASLSSSSVAENEYAAWASGTAYTAGQFCISTTTHRVYQCLANCTGKDPTDLNNQFGTVAYWLDSGPTNRWAMFDDQVSTQTTAPLSLSVVLRPGAFDSVYLAGLDAENISITVKDAPGGNVIYSYSQALEGSVVSDYDEYFFDPFKPMSDFLASGIWQYTGSELTVTLTSSGTVKCGVLAVGSLRVLGQTQRGAKAKPKTYSVIKTDDFGNTKITRRKAAMDLTASAILDVSEAVAVTQQIRDLLDQPAVWIASDLPQYGFLRVYGLGSGEISDDTLTTCQLSLTVQGLI